MTDKPCKENDWGCIDEDYTTWAPAWEAEEKWKEEEKIREKKEWEDAADAKKIRFAPKMSNKEIKAAIQEYRFNYIYFSNINKTRYFAMCHKETEKMLTKEITGMYVGCLFRIIGWIIGAALAVGLFVIVFMATVLLITKLIS